MTPLQEAEVLEKFAKTIRMCVEHGIEPIYKYKEFSISFLNFIDFQNFEDYKFPLAIVEGKLVFEGDELYTDISELLKVRNSDEFNIYGDSPQGYGVWSIKLLSWNPPKPKTILVEMTVEDAEYWSTHQNMFWAQLIVLKESCKKALEDSCKKALDSLK